MNKELIKIIESLCTRIEYTSSSGIVFVEFKGELCRVLRLRAIPRCEAVECIHCMFARGNDIDKYYSLKIEKVIQKF